MIGKNFQHQQNFFVVKIFLTLLSEILDTSNKNLNFEFCR